MIKYKFYKNGYEVIGHSKKLICAQFSAMNYVFEGIILELDKNAKCKDSETGSGYTALLIDNKDLFNLLDDFKKSISNWAKSEIKSNDYKIESFNNYIKWGNIDN